MSARAAVVAKPLAAPAPDTQANRTYVICASPRTGSTLLCNGLIRSNVAGFPRENFDDRPDVDREYKAALKIAPDDDRNYLAAVLRRSRTANGMRGLKVHWHQLGVLERMLRAGHAAAQTDTPDLAFDAYQRLLLGPVCWLWQRRRDKVAQAISLYRASRSHVWHHPVTKERRTEDDDVPYDFAAIDQLVHACFRYDRSWARYLGENGIPALVLWYEDFTANYEATMRGVFDHLGLAGATIPPPGLNRLANARSVDWGARYRQEKAARVLARQGVEKRRAIPLRVVD